MENACMISRTGRVIPVEVHPYVYNDFARMTLENGIWFYDHTENDALKQAFIDFVACQAKEDAPSDVIEYLKTTYSNISGLSGFIEEHKAEILSSYETPVTEKEALEVLVPESNQEFLRCRYGGTYKTVPGNRDIYFRVSSVGFNWYSIIWRYVYDNREFIDFVTIVRDVASTGKGFYYKSKHGEYNRMPVDDFLTETGNPIIEWKNKNLSVRKYLAMGGTISGITSLQMNPNRAMREFELLKQEENERPYFWQNIDYLVNDILEGQPVDQVILEYMIKGD